MWGEPDQYGARKLESLMMMMMGGSQMDIYMGIAAEIETSDIDTGELDTSSDSPSCAESHNRASEEL